MGVEIVVPIFLFGAVATVFIAAYFFSYRKRQIVYDAVKVAIEKTGQVDPSLVEAIIRDRIGPYADLRKGILLIVVAVAFVILGFAMDEAEALRPMIGVASFPGLIGLAYVAFHFFAPREAIV